MARLAWLSDLHLNFLAAAERDALVDQWATAQVDAYAISGDITESSELLPMLEQFETKLARPIYFVLGNHDYYFSSIAKVRRDIAALSQNSRWLHWLNVSGVCRLSADAAIVGHDGWADGRLGDYRRSFVSMNDWRLIEELTNLDRQSRWLELKRLADEAAAYVRGVLSAALVEYPFVYLVTHVPPFRGACWYEGRISDDEWLPHFSSKAMGDAILEVMAQHPSRRLTVLCGHTHSPGIYRPTQNVTVHTGGAEYGKPEIQQVFEVA